MAEEKAEVKATQPSQAQPKQAPLTQPSPDEFEWLQYQSPVEERNRLASAVIKNPFVAIGAIATVLALGLGITNMYRQNSRKQQFYMRCRVGAQGFTIASLIAGLFYHAGKYP